MAWQFSAGEILTAANLNAVTLPWNALCQVRMSAPQSINSGAATVLSFDTEDLDPLGWHAGGAPTLITPTIAGWYQVSVQYDWSTDTDYTRISVSVQKNLAAITPPYKDDLILTFASGAVPAGTVSGGLVSMNGSTDDFNVSVIQTNTGAGAETVDALLLVRLIYPT